MCFNPEASLIAFSIGFISWIILLYLKIYNAAIIVMYLYIMQLLEYFAHTSIIQKREGMNSISSKLIFIFVFLQPILFYVSTLLTDKKYFFKSSNNYLFLLPLYTLYSIYFYIYLDNKRLFKTTYLDDSCKSICRMSWDFFGYNKTFTLIGLLFYLSICIVFWKQGAVHYYAQLLFLISVLYTLFLSRKVKQILSMFGSIWCFLAVTYGPFVIISHYKA